MLTTVSLHTEPAHFHSPPCTGFRSVRSHLVCGVVVVVGALVVAAADLSSSKLLLIILSPGELTGVSSLLMHFNLAVAEPATFHE